MASSYKSIIRRPSFEKTDVIWWHEDSGERRSRPAFTADQVISNISLGRTELVCDFN